MVALCNCGRYAPCFSVPVALSAPRMAHRARSESNPALVSPGAWRCWNRRIAGRRMDSERAGVLFAQADGSARGQGDEHLDNQAFRVQEQRVRSDGYRARAAANIARPLRRKHIKLARHWTASPVDRAGHWPLRPCRASCLEYPPQTAQGTPASWS